MFLKLRSSLLLAVIAAVSIPQKILCSTSTTTQHPSSLHKPSHKQPIVYTAEKSRQEAYPSYKAPTIATNLAELYDEIKSEESTTNSKDQPENNGFVEPLDFNSFLSDVSYKGKKSNNLPLFTSESNTKDTFAGFFGSNKGRDSFIEPNFAGLSSAASDQKSRKHGGGNEDESGFVDPNVQFRSLFESSETADGFRPQDFLGSKDDSAGVDPSKGSQTRAFPSFTYTGRRGDDNDNDDHEPQSNNKYRSSYRQVDSRERDDRRDDRQEDRRDRDPYDDSNYYGGEHDDSPPPPPNPRYQNSNNNNRYHQRYGHGQDRENQGNQNRENYSPAVQESSHKPQASGPKAAESGGGGKGKCKKVEKQVDYNEDYAAYTDPEPDYDPSTYGQNERYKRQAGGRAQKRNNQGSKQPMTCYVCEDEQGRYAERCSYDSKADPKKGSYFTSSSTSFSDNGRGDNGRGNNGRGGRGGSERYRRNPSLSSKTVPTTTAASASNAQPVATSASSDNSERDKRQSPGNGERNNNSNNSNNNNNNNYDGDYQDNSNERGNDYNYDDYDGGDYGAGSQRSGSGNNDEYGSPSNTQGSRGGSGGGNGNDDRNYGFGPPQRGNRNGNGRGSEFDFGPPTDFGSTTAGSNNNDQGFNFDFSIPRDFDSGANLGTSNTNNRPVFSGSSNNDNFGFGGGANFDTGYEDYVKKYFPDAFSNEGGGSGSTPGPSPASSSYRPHGHSSSSPRPSHGHGGHSPNKEHTQQSHNYAPPPYYQQHGNEHGGHLDKIIGGFNQKDRSGCQKMHKGDMTCYVCRDAHGMNKEECMYASGDPNGKNTRMAYHESTEYSSPHSSILPLPKPATSTFSPHTLKLSSSQNPPTVVHTKITKEESKIVEKKKSPIDYDFDY